MGESIKKPGISSMTRGWGLLEPWLAKQRSHQANLLIPHHLRQGRILDIGCGSFPYFLSHTYFREKYAVDQNHKPDQLYDINWHLLDLNTVSSLPFEDDFFDVITMLAVVEHLDPAAMTLLFCDIHRLLKPGGAIVMTTPSAWSNNLLKYMARFGLVSSEEIQEHVFAYTLPLLGWYFGRAGFSMHKVRFGYFELGMNMWAIAQKDDP
jgi:2-polyprenyl-3-methyl-5-hydroxy-6-metoxy-1,4-benzoquinol methylase